MPVELVPGVPGTGASRAAAGPGQGAGLVPSKTSQGEALLVSFGASVQAEARVKRLKRSVWASGHLHKLAEAGHRPPVAWFVTLTYADAHGWRADHMSKAVERFRQWCRRKCVPCRYTWVAEIQPKRLARTGQAVVHYHLLAWLPCGVRMPFWDTSPDGKRPPFWEHGMSERDEARSGVGYLMKYLSKLGEFHRFPKGLRLYGIGGLDEAARSVRRWFNLPEWAKALAGVGDVTARVRGGLVLRTGEILFSPWSVQRVPGGLLLSLKTPLAERWFAGAYSKVSC